jgi:hypothetical protein
MARQFCGFLQQSCGDREHPELGCEDGRWDMGVAEHDAHRY